MIPSDSFRPMLMYECQEGPADALSGVHEVADSPLTKAMVVEESYSSALVSELEFWRSHCQYSSRIVLQLSARAMRPTVREQQEDEEGELEDDLTFDTCGGV